MSFSFVEDEETSYSEQPNIEKSFHTVNLEDGVEIELSEELVDDMSIDVVKPTFITDTLNLPCTSKSLDNANHYPSYNLTITEGVKIKLSEEKYEKYFRKIAHCLSDVVEEDEAIIDTDSEKDENSDEDTSSEKKKQSSNDEKKNHGAKKKRSHKKKETEKKTGDVKPQTPEKKKKCSKSKTKDKIKKDSDETSTSSKTSISEQEPKKKRRKKTDTKEPETKDNTDETYSKLYARERAADRQRKKRSSDSEKTKAFNREKAKKKMSKIRKRKSKSKVVFEKRLNAQRRYLQRLSKKANSLILNSKPNSPCNRLHSSREDIMTAQKIKRKMYMRQYRQKLSEERKESIRIKDKLRHKEKRLWSRTSGNDFPF
ncbi:protein FAM133A-like isoform X2 [Frankliniella occidentalis]|nr:protein FAM133A-like isoform X2 [Frankliniella occidentalis]